MKRIILTVLMLLVTAQAGAFDLWGTGGYGFGVANSMRPIFALPLASTLTATDGTTATFTGGTPSFTANGLTLTAGQYADYAIANHFGMSEGTLYAELLCNPGFTTSQVPIGIGAESNPMYKSSVGPSLRQQRPGIAAYGELPWLDDGLVRSIAVTWSVLNNRTRFAMDGVLSAVTTFPVPFAGTNIRIGATSAGTAQWLGSIKNIKIYPKALHDSWIASQTAMSFLSARPMNILAHTGFAGEAPENTMAAFGNAIARGATTLEFDVHVSSDGVPVVIHDTTVDAHSNGTGNVKDLTAAQLRALDAGSWFSPAFAGEKIPLLSEVIALAVANPNIKLMPEIKGYRTTDDIALIVQPILDAGIESRTTFTSLTYTDFPLVRALSTSSRLGFVAADVSTALTAAIASPYSYKDVLVDYAYVIASPTSVATAASNNIGMITWTVDTWDTATKVRRLGVTDILSNWPLSVLQSK